MYDIPSQENAKECIISEEVIFKREKPFMLNDHKSKFHSTRERARVDKRNVSHG